MWSGQPSSKRVPGRGGVSGSGVYGVAEGRARRRDVAGGIQRGDGRGREVRESMTGLCGNCGAPLRLVHVPPGQKSVSVRT